MNSLFNTHEGANILRKPSVIIFILILTGILGYVMAKVGFMLALVFIMLPLVVIYLTTLFDNPIIGLYAYTGNMFIILGSTRYFAWPFPVGLVIDILLVLTIAAYYIYHYPNPPSWKAAFKAISLLYLIWFIYCFIQVANPEAQSVAAWMAALRPVGLHPLLIVALVFVLVKDLKQIRVLMLIWGIFSLLATLKGWSQLYIGVDRFEQIWLDNGGDVTHILWGKLRVFSFYSDAGEFGAHQAYTGVVFFIMAQMTKKRLDKIFFYVVAFAGFYGMMISGTRGAMVVPFLGFGLYFLHMKNIKLMTVGGIMVIALFVFFRFTSIGNGNYQINRMRTAFNPTDDPSFLVRLENQRRLKIYMSARPIGGGLGHGGVKAQKYLPNAFLSNTATDSYYVMIWVELGIVGLFLVLVIQFYTLGWGTYLVMFRLKNDELKALVSGLTAGMVGLMLAGYAGQAIGQLPASGSVFLGTGIIFNALFLDKSIRITRRKVSRNQKLRKRLQRALSNAHILPSFQLRSW